MIPIILITGFLGSGKTTWLKQIAQDHRDQRFIYLVNDFAAVDVDGELVKQAGEHVMAVSGGSIFCKCLVSEFIATLRTISEGRAGMDGLPEAVIIEASGMADPRVIHTMLRETELDQQFKIARIVAIADPGTLHKLLKTLPNIRAQIACADTVLISKADRYPQEVIADTRTLVAQIQPNAKCGLILNGITDIPLFEEATSPSVDGEYAACRDPRYHRFVLAESPPTLTEFQKLTEETKEHLYRAKGFVRDDAGQVYAVDWSSSGYQAIPWPSNESPTLRVVCIAAGADGPAVESMWKT